MAEHRFDFDRVIDRRGTDSIKWNLFEPDVLPLWVADMDFPAPPAVIDALRDRVEHGIFGYPQEPPELRAVIVDWIAQRYGWKVTPEAIVFVPNVVVGFNLAAHALARQGSGLLIQTPIYFPILDVPDHAGLEARLNRLVRDSAGRYEIDFDDFARLAREASMFLLCNPHNPVGRVYTRAELEQMAEICVRNGVYICSDEIHADFVYDGRRHVPIASIASEIADRTVTLFAPNKSFNVAGISCGIAIVPNPELRARLKAAQRGLVPHPGIMSYVVAEAAYRHGEEWLDDLIAYLAENRDYVTQFVRDELPGVKMGPIEGTYLAWLDCRDALDGNPHEFFLRRARVALNDGARFGPGGEGFVRLNFACPRSTLAEALNRMRIALTDAG